MSDSSLFEPLHVSLSAGEVERHTIYLRLVAALIARSWRWNKFVQHQGATSPHARVDDDPYPGHNIGALAVDRDGTIVDWKTNANHDRGSLLEHAEIRLLQALFDKRETDDTYGGRLSGITVYSNLEPCFACAGMLSLSRAHQVVYLQADSDAHSMLAAMYRLRQGSRLPAPLPVSAGLLALDFTTRLNETYALFADRQRSRTGDPIAIHPDGKPLYSAAMTSFLCSKDAYDIYDEMRALFENDSLKHGGFRTNDDDCANAERLELARAFYASERAR